MRVVLLSFVSTLLSTYFSIVWGILDKEYSDAISSAIANLPKITYVMRFRPSDPGHEAVDKVLHVTDTTLDHWKMMPKLSPEEQKHRIKLMIIMLHLLDVPYGTYTLNMAYHATLIIRVLLKYPYSRSEQAAYRCIVR